MRAPGYFARLQTEHALEIEDEDDDDDENDLRWALAIRHMLSAIGHLRSALFAKRYARHAIRGHGLEKKNSFQNFSSHAQAQGGCSQVERHGRT
jgi:hypothetical protein